MRDFRNRVNCSKAMAATFAATAILCIAGCATQQDTGQSRPTIEVEGDFNAPGSEYYKQEGDVVLRTSRICSTDGAFAFAIGAEIDLCGTDNLISISKGGCLVKREAQDLFDVVSCAAAPPSGCLEGQVKRNTVHYAQRCQEK